RRSRLLSNSFRDCEKDDGIRKDDRRSTNAGCDCKGIQKKPSRCLVSIQWHFLKIIRTPQPLAMRAIACPFAWTCRVQKKRRRRSLQFLLRRVLREHLQRYRSA